MIGIRLARASVVARRAVRQSGPAREVSNRPEGDVGHFAYFKNSDDARLQFLGLLRDREWHRTGVKKPARGPSRRAGVSVAELIASFAINRYFLPLRVCSAQYELLAAKRQKIFALCAISQILRDDFECPRVQPHPFGGRDVTLVET